MVSTPEANTNDLIDKEEEKDQQESKGGDLEQEKEETDLPIEELVERQEGVLKNIVNWVNLHNQQEQQERLQEIKDKELYDSWLVKRKKAEQEWKTNTMLRNTVINLAGYAALLFGVIYPLFSNSFLGLPSWFLGSIIRGTPPWQALESKVRNFFDKRRDDYKKYQEIIKQNPQDPINKRIRRNKIQFVEAAKKIQEKKKKLQEQAKQELAEGEELTEVSQESEAEQNKTQEAKAVEQSPKTREEQIAAIQNRNDISDDVKEALVRALRG